MIIVTAGPNLFHRNIIEELSNKGLEAIRISASKQPPLEQLNKMLPLNDNIKIIVDFPGGKHRLNNPGNFSVKENEIIKLSKEELVYSYIDKLAIYPKFKEKLKIGELLIVGDGESAFTVIEDNQEEIIVKVEREAILGPRRGISPVSMIAANEMLTESDYRNMECLKDRRVTSIMLSYVEDGENVKKCREYIRNKYDREIEIFSKIETAKGIEQLDKITEESDYIVLARGDLLVTAGEERFPVLQDEFLERMKEVSEKAIIATGLAASLSKGYLMSRAELSFLYYIGKLGYKNLLLASETAVQCNPCKVYDKVSKLIDNYTSN